MKINTFGNRDDKAIMLLHGGGLSWWSLKPHIDELTKNNDYFVIAPTIDGHGDDNETTFISIENTASKIIEYIKTDYNGKLHAIWGLSIGAQILVEILSREADITDFAIMESALVIPMKLTVKLTKSTYDMTYPLIKKRWFSKLQSKSLFLPEIMFEDYYSDSSNMSKETLINMTTSNSSFSIPKNLDKSNAKTLVLVGGKELNIMKKSAYLINQTMKNSSLAILENCGHGQLCMQDPKSHLEFILSFIIQDF